MATKPTTIPQLWAADALYTTGPFVGSIQKVNPGAPIAAQGHRPGAADPTAAEHENYQQFWIDTWLREWVYLGTFDPDPDAHIVETDATGRAGLHGLTVNDTVDEIAILINGVNTFVPTVLAQCTTGANVFETQIGASAGTCYSAALPLGLADSRGFSASVGIAGTGVEVFMTATSVAAGGGGVVSRADAISTASAIVGVHEGVQTFAYAAVTGNSSTNIFGGHFQSDARAVDAAGLGVNSYGLYAYNVGSSNPAAIVSAALSPGATALEVLGLDGNLGIDAVTTNVSAVRAETTSASAIVGISTSGNGITTTVSSGVGGAFQSISGAGITAVSSSDFAARFTADTTSPTLGTLFLTGQDARPTSNSSGQLSYLSTERQFAHSNLQDGDWRGIWSSTGGYCMARGTLTTKLLNAGAGVWSDVITITASNGNAPKIVGQQVLIRISCDVSSSLATNNILNVRVLDDSNGGNIVFTRSNATGYTNVYTIGGIRERSVSIAFLATSTVAATQVYRLQMGTNTAASNLTALDISFDFLGQD